MDGSANEALLRLLAGELSVPRSAVRLEAGATGRLKRISVAGAVVDTVTESWPGIALSQAGSLTGRPKPINRRSEAR